MTKDYAIGKAEDLGCDTDGGKWILICTKHDLIFNFRTKKSAVMSASTICIDQCSAFICLDEEYE